MWLKRIVHKRSVLSTALLQRYVLLLGSYDAVGAARIAPAAAKLSHRSCSSAGLSKTKECFPTSSISSYRYPCLRRWDYRLLLPSSTCKSTLQQSRSLCSEEIEDLQWTDVDTPELLQLIASEDIQLFDVREPEELEETGMIPRAVNLPLGEVESALKMTAEDFLKKYGAPKPSKEDTNIVFHCRAGVRSLDAMETAHQLGYKKARHYICGWLGWEEYLDTQGEKN